MRSMLAALPILLLLASCELTEITIASPQDVIITELVLRANDPLQTAYVHRTVTPGAAGAVPNATIIVRDETAGTSFTLAPTGDSVCLQGAPPNTLNGGATCYAANVSTTAVRPGARYTLRVEMPDGRVATGATVVPGAFAIIQPGRARLNEFDTCGLPSGTAFDIIWTKSAGAAVYLTEARLRNLRQALRASGLEIAGNDAVELGGLSIGASDTIMRFPSDLGLFDRFDDDLIPLLLAIRDGLPAGVDVTLVVAAADRNYVNWVRGGNFNPSGVVQISSIQGDGRGVFGSLVNRRINIATYPGSYPFCN
ncbi:MAG: DUF4249 family protein [Longimicrobiales bacterium]